MVAAIALQSQPQPKNEQFYKLTLEELKQDYKNKRINAEAYLKYLIKTKLAAGWEWRFNVKQFCSEWEIAERTFYWALSLLKIRNEISWRPVNDNIILWWDKKVAKIANVDFSHLANRPNTDTVIAPQDVAEPLQDVAEQNPQTLTVVKSHNASYSLHIDLEKYTDLKEEVCVVSEKVLDQEPECEQQNSLDEINQDPIPGSLPSTLLNDTETLQVVDITSDGGLDSAPPISNTEIGQVANITSSEGKGFAPPIRKTSQKEKWVCPGTEEEKNEFLIFKGELLVAAKQCKPVEARTAALSWANHNLEAANLLWEDWQRQKAGDANQNTAIETVPEFRRMPEQEHAEVLEKFINHTKQEFLNLCWWHEYWLEFACRQFRVGQQLVPGLTAEIIKKIKAY